jgi:hypothetical protein
MSTFVRADRGARSALLIKSGQRARKECLIL